MRNAQFSMRNAQWTVFGTTRLALSPHLYYSIKRGCLTSPRNHTETGKSGELTADEASASPVRQYDSTKKQYNKRLSELVRQPQNSTSSKENGDLAAYFLTGVFGKTIQKDTATKRAKAAKIYQLVCQPCQTVMAPSATTLSA